jgi:hypothetical protein
MLGCVLRRAPVFRNVTVLPARDNSVGWIQQQKHSGADVRLQGITFAPGLVKPVTPPRAPGPASPSRPC